MRFDSYQTESFCERIFPFDIIPRIVGPEEWNWIERGLKAVKAANEAGGYGMLVGPHSTAEQRQEFAARIIANPRNYIAQPTLALSRVPTLVDGHFEGRHVDLRPFYGDEINGGLTQVALGKGSTSVDRIIEIGLHEYLDSLPMRMNTVDNSILNDFMTRRPENQAAEAYASS